MLGLPPSPHCGARFIGREQLSGSRWLAPLIRWRGTSCVRQGDADVVSAEEPIGIGVLITAHTHVHTSMRARSRIVKHVRARQLNWESVRPMIRRSPVQSRVWAFTLQTVAGLPLLPMLTSAHTLPLRPTIASTVHALRAVCFLKYACAWSLDNTWCPPRSCCGRRNAGTAYVYYGTQGLRGGLEGGGGPPHVGTWPSRS